MTGGVTEAVLRRLASDKSRGGLYVAAGVRGMKGVKEARVPYLDREVRIAIVSGLANAEALIQKLRLRRRALRFLSKSCGPPRRLRQRRGTAYSSSTAKAERGEGLYAVDRVSSIKRSEENSLVQSLYGDVLRGRVHELLHVDYTKDGGHKA